jgi:hypothetical protein
VRLRHGDTFLRVTRSLPRSSSIGAQLAVLPLMRVSGGQESVFVLSVCAGALLESWTLQIDNTLMAIVASAVAAGQSRVS